MSQERDLPLKAASEFDATPELTGHVLKRGDNEVREQAQGGLRLIVRATAKKKLNYRVVNARGDPVTTQSVRVAETRPDRGGAAAKATVTCWECGVDSSGNRHCWKVPCPDIVGPWVPGQRLAVAT